MYTHHVPEYAKEVVTEAIDLLESELLIRASSDANDDRLACALCGTIEAHTPDCPIMVLHDFMVRNK